MSWRVKARCQGMDTALFFPAKGAWGLDAKQVCARCPVQIECLESELTLADDQQHGVFGRTTPYARKAIKNQRSIGALE